MTAYKPWLLLAGWFWTAVASAQLQLLPEGNPQEVLGGDTRNISVTWHNVSGQTAVATLRAQIWQASSTTATPLDTIPWKIVRVLPRQTVIENAPINFPAVNTESDFLVLWLEGKNTVAGKTEVMVYPANLMHELKLLAGENDLGIWDPNHELQPLLRENGVRYLDLGEKVLTDFRGKLAIIGPFESKLQIRPGLAETIRTIASKGVAVVWLQPPPSPKEQIKPSFYFISVGKGTVVVAQAGLVADLRDNPQSQLNLIYFCKLAVHPESFTLPDLAIQP